MYPPHLNNINCRTCLSADTKYNLNDKIEEYTILEMLQGIVPQINITENSVFSRLICENCVNNLLTGFKFQKLCIETEYQLRQILEDIKIANPPCDPLMEVENVMKLEQDNECVAEDNLEVLIKCDTDSVDNDVADFAPDCSDTDTSNEKLSVLKERELRLTRGLKCSSRKSQKHRKCERNLKSTKRKSKSNPMTDLTDEINGETNLTTHSIKTSHSCEICNRCFSSAKFLSNHQMKRHKGQNEDDKQLKNTTSDDFPCTQCSIRFATPSLLKEHRRIHKKVAPIQEIICEICQTAFESTRPLIRHIKTEHPKAERYSCDKCNESFILRSHLTKHLKQRHKKKQLFCEICERDFKYKSSLEKHMRSHNGERPYLCQQCGKTFRSSSNLSEHMTRHAGQATYPCPECPRRFKCGSDLRKHRATHTNYKPHECDICGFRFSRAYSLLEHKRLHTGERPHKCEQCQKSFAILYHLKRHMRTHTGEKPYKCKYCNKSYAVGGDLTKHLRIHLGEKTYLCNECPMAFKYNSELRKHLIEHFKMSQEMQENGIEGDGKIEEKKEETTIEKKENM
ncbi:uncharacterized protein [Musca autumnalis]|uniref:uncharacterized protein n=1 Tax=Musca autumnalis TaxID=221902 RepID=UPI003CF3C987